MKVVEFPSKKSHKIKADTVMKEAMGELKGVIVIGVDKAGDYYFSTNIGSFEALWLVERFKQVLLEETD